MWSDFSQFLAMGGYGLFVWGSLVVCAMVPLIEILTLSQRRSALSRNSGDDDDTNPS
jgi:heme exporter protein D